MREVEAREVGLFLELLPTGFRAAQLFPERYGVTGYLTRYCYVYTLHGGLQYTSDLEEWTLPFRYKILIKARKGRDRMASSSLCVSSFIQLLQVWFLSGGLVEEGISRLGKVGWVHHVSVQGPAIQSYSKIHPDEPDYPPIINQTSTSRLHESRLSRLLIRKSKLSRNPDENKVIAFLIISRGQSTYRAMADMQSPQHPMEVLPAMLNLVVSPI